MEITPETLERGLNGLDLFSQESSSPTYKPQDSHMMPSSSSSSSSSSLIIGDYIGMESCVDVLKDGDEYYDHHSPEAVDQSDLFGGKPDQRLEMEIKTKKKKKKKKASFPPPIPLLARTENLPCRMPWVLKRHYTSDGRLILTEEKVRHHEYFRAHRSNGRLTLQLVPLDDDDVVTGDDDTPLVDGVDEDDSNNHVDCGDDEEFDDDGEVNIDGCDGVDYDEEELERNENRIGVEEAKYGNSTNTSIEGRGEGRKRLNYGTSVRSAGGSCCIFGMAAVPAIKTVHS